MKRPEISIDDTGLTINGVPVSLEAKAADVEAALGEHGTRRRFGPAHLSKPTDNQAVVFEDAGVVLLERIGSGDLSQLDCIFEPSSSPVSGVVPFEGNLDLLGVQIEAVMQKSELRALSAKAQRRFLKSFVFETAGLIAYLLLGKPVRGQGVSILHVSVGPKALA
ncbi:MAG: hypothetical protein M5U25_01660 [Planctomycetota bacterium]|nr:hypothetical protein [Planctomycetota bacterium]